MTSCRVRRAVGDLRQTDAAGLALRGKFHRADDQALAHRAAPALPVARRTVFRAERSLRLVDLDQRLQRAAAGIDHRPAQRVEQELGGLVAAQPALRLKLERRHAIEMAGKKVGSKESGLQRKVAGLQVGSRRHRSLPPTARALPGRPIPVQFPALATATGGADQALRPPPLDEIPRRGPHHRRCTPRILGATGGDPIFSGRALWNTTPAARPSLTTSGAIGTKGISL